MFPSKTLSSPRYPTASEMPVANVRASIKISFRGFGERRDGTVWTPDRSVITRAARRLAPADDDPIYNKLYPI
jgi:hypothetical protein